MIAIVLRTWWLAAIVSGCQPTPPLLPVTGEIALEFAPSAGTDVRFKLTNQSSRTVAFRGSRLKDRSAYPWDAWIECSKSETSSWTEGPYAMVDGEAGDIEIGTGEQLDVVLGFGHHRKFAAEYKGGRCRFNLKLLDGAVLTSDEFQP